MFRNYFKLALRNILKEKTYFIINLFGLTIGLAVCLGVFGLTALAIKRRMKEICIRKIMGISLSGILQLLSRDYLVMVLLATLVSWPITYFIINAWLQNFAYRISITIWPFLLAGISALGIAWLTVSWQAIRAATANPVESLRYE
jgi:putative ABC transport system permease protein